MSNPSDVKRFIAGSQDKGINTFEPDLSSEVTWDESTTGVTSGIRRGVAPSYGMAPIPGHSDTETTSGSRTNGLMASEGATGQGLQGRELIFGIVPITLTEYDGAWPKKNRRFYAYLVGLDDTSNVSLDLCLGSTLSSTIYKQSADIRAGLMASSYKGESPLVRRHKTELLNLPTAATATASDVATAVRAVGSRYWTPWAHFMISGKRIPYQWMLGDATSTPNGTTMPGVCLWQIPVTVSGPTNDTILGGCPSEIITRESPAPTIERFIKMWCLTVAGAPIDMTYTRKITQADTVATVDYGTAAHYSSGTATKGGASTSYASVAAVLLNDPEMFTNSRHDAVLVAGETPYALIYQDWLRAATGMKPRWVDLTKLGCEPRKGLVNDGIESGFFSQAALSTLGDNTGIFEEEVTYDIGFSFYNKLLDYETNVIFGIKQLISAGTADFTALYFPTESGANENMFRIMASIADHYPPWEYSATTLGVAIETPRQQSINDYSIRFYYRQEGTADWLPVEEYDAAKAWFYPFVNEGGQMVIGQNPVARTIGGQPGGFVDYSPLPKQRYICVLNFNQRAFWFSEKGLYFSLQNNVYVYPTRNAFNIPTGVCRGGIVHTQPGDVEQRARLIIFGSDVSYASRFSGVKLQQQVRVSADTIGQFDVDGSDFVIDYLCDSTAYSYRAACVAEGILYFWGPKGVYMDEGVDKPVPISGMLEPEIFDYVDTGRIDEVHAIYNRRTKEIIWFYPPKVADADFPTHGLIYNTVTGKFYPGKWRCQIDSAQAIKLENDDTPDGIDGERLIVHARASSSASVSRSFFFDELCKSGEQGPGRELVAKTITTPATGQRRLTMAAGHTALTQISVNDYIAIQNAAGYAPTGLPTANAFLAKVIGVNNGSSYVDIELPPGAVLPNASLTYPEVIPIYHAGHSGFDLTPGLHGISWNIQTNYWLPSGVADFWTWRYLYMLFKFLAWPAPTDLKGRKIGTFLELGYRTLNCEAEIADILALRDCSEAALSGLCQIHHPLRNEGVAAQGQALKYRLSGVHLGHEWTLEYLEAQCVTAQGFGLKEFEG